MFMMIESGTRSPRAMYSRAARPVAVPSATCLRSRSPLEMCVSPKRSAICTACVPLPAPGAPINSTRMSPAISASCLCGEGATTAAALGVGVLTPRSGSGARLRQPRGVDGLDPDRPTGGRGAALHHVPGGGFEGYVGAAGAALDAAVRPHHLLGVVGGEGRPPVVLVELHVGIGEGDPRHVPQPEAVGGPGAELPRPVEHPVL